MKFTVQGNTPFSAHICQYLYDLESNFAKEKLSLPLSQIIAHILYGTKRIRLGNEAIPSEAITILEECIEANQPIPVNCIFGSSESEKDYVDIAEFQSLQTLKDISRRVAKFYYPGLNIRLDVVGDSKYVSKVMRLATVLGGFTIGTHQSAINSLTTGQHTIIISLFRLETFYEADMFQLGTVEVIYTWNPHMIL